MSNRLTWKGSRRQLLGTGATAGAGLAGLALVGCGDDDDDDSTPTATSTTATGTSTASATGTSTTTSEPPFQLTGDLNFGFVSSFTGPLAPIYAPFLIGAQIAIDEINASGGIAGAQVKLVEADDQSNAANIPSAVLGLVDKKVSFCLGPVGGAAVPAAPILNQNKIIEFAYTTEAELADPTKFPYTFLWAWTRPMAVQTAVDYLRKQGHSKLAILGENNSTGQPGSQITRDYMKSINLEPTLVELFPNGTTDFVPILRKVEDAGSDAVVWWGAGGPEAGAVVISADAIDFKLPFAGTVLYDAGLRGKVKQEILDRIFTVMWKSCTYTDTEEIAEEVLELKGKLEERNGLGSIGSGLTSPFYDMVYLLKGAIEGARSIETSEVVKWMEAHTHEGVIAHYNGLSPTNHCVIGRDQVVMNVLGSYEESRFPFYKRAPNA